MKLIVFAVSVLLAVALAASNALAAVPGAGTKPAAGAVAKPAAAAVTKPAAGAVAKPAAAAVAKPAPAPAKKGGIVLMEGDVIKGTRQAPSVYYVLEPAKPAWRAPEPTRTFLGDVERSAGSGAL